MTSRRRTLLWISLLRITLLRIALLWITLLRVAVLRICLLRITLLRITLLLISLLFISLLLRDLIRTLLPLRMRRHLIHHTLPTIQLRRPLPPSKLARSRTLVIRHCRVEIRRRVHGPRLTRIWRSFMEGNPAHRPCCCRAWRAHRRVSSVAGGAGGGFCSFLSDADAEEYGCDEEAYASD